MSSLCLWICLHCLVHALLSQTSADGEGSNTGTTIAVAIVSVVLCVIVVAIGFVLYRRKMQRSLNNDISNLDIEEVTQSDLPDTNKNGKKHRDANTKKDENKNKHNSKQKERQKSKGNRKHSTDVLDIEEEENASKPTQSTQIVVTSANGQANSNGAHTNGTNMNIVAFDTDDELSYQGNLHTPADSGGHTYAGPTLDVQRAQGSNAQQHEIQSPDPDIDLDIDLDDEASD
eukprot:CAMPEP_0197041314 /NCGR_PEP_ID=MMETSP1384-20130603/17870_1 /TAXON_ID=29189 /ORGANISM="Ammonia sp." /LENGTH=230 /DNA_ID=CAMNT_0042472203 /DNA_START=16 /DNA_END=708 /DNA_ORIENTATION=-